MGEEAGNKETYLAFEESTRRNVLASIEYNKETRALFRKAEKEIINLTNLVHSYKNELNLMKKQLVAIQIEKYKGGTQ